MFVNDMDKITQVSNNEHGMYMCTSKQCYLWKGGGQKLPDLDYSEPGRCQKLAQNRNLRHCDCAESLNYSRYPEGAVPHGESQMLSSNIPTMKHPVCCSHRHVLQSSSVLSKDNPDVSISLTTLSSLTIWLSTIINILSLGHKLFVHKLLWNKQVSSRLFGIGRALVIFVCFLSMTSAQVCLPEVSCYPPSFDLIVDSTPGSVSVVTSSMCGSAGPENYQAESGDTIYTCDTTTPHLASDMVDRARGGIGGITFDNPVIESYWQSKNTWVSAGVFSPESIVVRFPTKYLIQYVRIVFISPHVTREELYIDMRPRAIVMEIQVNDTSEWDSISYYADDCAARFPGVEICRENYVKGDTTTESGWLYGLQETKFAIQSDLKALFETDYLTNKKYTVSAVRFRLTVPAIETPLASYYAVSDLEIDGVCQCYGHASSCSVTLSQALCDCQHNTIGPHCEDCQPLFNNKPWRMGANGMSNACEDCGCNDHASMCRYDELKGYGVCVDCTENTAGDKCDQCLTHFYVNPDKDLYNATNPAPEDCQGYNGGTGAIETYNCASWCIPCDCNLDGSISSSGYNCDSTTGECSCKMAVDGRACDRCKDGYWNLTASNIAEGCTLCKCRSAGTINNTNICDKTTGLCVCKENVDGDDCGRCKQNHYGLEFGKVEGCTACDCDPGGSLEPGCPETGTGAGLCDCRPNIGGRKCDTPIFGFFRAPLDYHLYDAEYSTDASSPGFAVVEEPGHNQLDGKVTGRGFLQVLPSGEFTLSVSVKTTGPYNVVIRYMATALVMATQVELTILGATEIGQTYECDGTVYPIDQTITVGPVNLPGTQVNTPDGLIMGVACPLGQREYQMTVKIGTSLADNVLIDSVVFLPVLDSLYVFNNATTETQAAITECYDNTLPVDLAIRANLSCSNYEYSIMTELFGGAIECQCSGPGIQTSQCDARGGQCDCKPGVMLRGCTECMVDHYGFSTGLGCTPCECHPTGSVKTSCNDTGICECNPNVLGIKCDSCVAESFGLASGDGCTPCVCEAQYSVNNSCQDDGQCYCKPGIGGVSCTECLPGFYNLTSEGCTPCGCDPDGSTGTLCDPDSGVCTCKARATGDKCDTCLETFYGVGPWHPDGCLECFCSGHIDTCGTAQWYYAVNSYRWSLTNNEAVAAKWGGIDDKGEAIVVDIVPKFGNGDEAAEYAMSILDGGFNAGRNNLYFTATGFFLGDKRGAYGLNISFELSLTLPTLDPNVTAELLDDKTGDVILVGNWTTYKLVAALPSTPNENKTTYVMQMHESSWHVDTTDGPLATRQEFMMILSGLQQINIRATYYNVNRTVTDLYFVQMYYAAPEAASLEQVITNVEDCEGFCPPQYTGQFCEQCAPGFKRLDPEMGPFSQCIPCVCNEHEGGACDASTGVCNCTHFTTGDTCQTCVDGYYGDPTQGTPGDCQPCLCPGNVPEGHVNTFAGTCEVDAAADFGYKCINCSEGHGGDHCEFCVDQWFGEPENEFNNFGVCRQCSCNDRADTCNTTTGDCIDCRNNTAGMECDICASGFTGRAPTCKPCDCGGSIGATGDCDHFTGVCECKPNVIGVRCDQCAYDSYDIESGLGCTPCDCHTVGASQTNCNQTTGQCTCRHPTIVGQKCDQCEVGYWNIRNLGCIPCDCTTEGTVPGSISCELETGSCQCVNPGVIGRTCDQCAKGTTVDFKYVQGIFIGVYPECELCGECYDNWAKKIDAVGVELTSLYQTAMAIWSNYDNLTYEEVSPILEYIGGNLTAVESSISMAMDMVSQLNYLKDGFEEVNIDAQNHSEIATNITTYGQQVQLALSANQQFKGPLQINNTHQATPDDLVQWTSNALNYINTLYGAANSTWSDIETQTALIQESNGNIDIFLVSVTTAMVVLNQAQTTRQAAETILSGPFGAQYADNTLKLNQLQTVINGYPAQIQQVRLDAQNAEAMCFQANNTAVSATSLVNQRQEEMAAKVVQAERAKNNASVAKAASLQAESAVLVYQELANNTKLQMTRTIEDIARGLRDLASVESDILLSMETETNTSLVVLPALQEMQDITVQIEAAQVSPEEVTQTLLDAENGLQVAAEAQNVTEIAVAESKAALLMFNTTTDNLTTTNELNAETKRNLDQLQEKNSTVRLILQQVSSKALDNQELADQTQFTINSLLAFIGTISQCITSQGILLDATALSLSSANLTAYTAGQKVVANQNQANEMNAPIEDKLNELETQYADVTQLQDEVNALMSDLDDVTSIIDLQRMLNEYTAQKLEMNALLSELNALEGQLDALLAALNLLEPAATTCSNN